MKRVGKLPGGGYSTPARPADIGRAPETGPSRNSCGPTCRPVVAPAGGDHRSEFPALELRPAGTGVFVGANQWMRTLPRTRARLVGTGAGGNVTVTGEAVRAAAVRAAGPCTGWFWHSGAIVPEERSPEAHTETGRLRPDGSAPPVARYRPGWRTGEVARRLDRAGTRPNDTGGCVQRRVGVRFADPGISAPERIALGISPAGRISPLALSVFPSEMDEDCSHRRRSGFDTYPDTCQIAGVAGP